MKIYTKIIIILLIVLMILATSGCVKKDTSTADPYKDYEPVNITYPVEAIIYGIAYGQSFTEVRYNDNGVSRSVSDISAHVLDGWHVNDMTIKYIDGNDSYIRWDYKAKINRYPIGIYTLYQSRKTPIYGTTTEFREGKHNETASTTLAYKKE